MLKNDRVDGSDVNRVCWGAQAYSKPVRPASPAPDQLRTGQLRPGKITVSTSGSSLGWSGDSEIIKKSPEIEVLGLERIRVEYECLTPSERGARSRKVFIGENPRSGSG